jgi:hypothetical protein
MGAVGRHGVLLLLWLILLSFLIVGGGQASGAEEFHISPIEAAEVPAVSVKSVLISDEALKEDRFSRVSNRSPVVRREGSIESAWGEWVGKAGCPACRAAPKGKLSMLNFRTVLQGKGRDRSHKLAINQQIIDDGWPSSEIDPCIIDVWRWVDFAVFDQLHTAEKQPGAFGIYQNINIFGSSFGGFLTSNSTGTRSSGGLYGSVSGGFDWLISPSGLYDLPRGETGQSESKYGCGGERYYGPFFAAALLWCFSFLFGVVAFKLVRKSIDTGRNSLIFRMAMIFCICSSGSCFAYGLINFLSPIVGQHDLASTDCRSEDVRVQRRARARTNNCPARWQADFRFRTYAATCAAVAAFRFLRQPSSPNAPRPVAKSGRAAGNGVAATGVAVAIVSGPASVL